LRALGRRRARSLHSSGVNMGVRTLSKHRGAEQPRRDTMQAFGPRRLQLRTPPPARSRLLLEVGPCVRRVFDAARGFFDVVARRQCSMRPAPTEGGVGTGLDLPRLLPTYLNRAFATSSDKARVLVRGTRRPIPGGDDLARAGSTARSRSANHRWRICKTIFLQAWSAEPSKSTNTQGSIGLRRPESARLIYKMRRP
jgi:hypothetical protein